MQNIPGILLDNAHEQKPQAVSFPTVKRGDNHALFADLFDQHASMIDSELSMTPVSTEEKMLENAPLVREEAPKQPVSVANTKAPVKEDKEPALPDDHARDQRMTQEDLDEVRDDLEEYGMTQEEIAEIEEKVNSEEGLTWGQFVSTVAEKMADLRKVELSDEQKEALSAFFAKFGFDEKQSAKLIKQIEHGEQGKVMAQLQARIDEMPKQQQLLFTNEEVQAFSAAMNFSKEFTSKIKELFGQNLMAKDIKEAFTMIRQEMAEMDEKDAELVRSVGKAIAKAMGEQAKESSAAKDVGQAVDLKPRVSEDPEQSKAAVKEDLKEAVENRREAMPGSNAAKSDKKVMPDQAQTEDLSDHTDKQKQENTWNDFFGKLQGGDNPAARGQAQIKTSSLDAALSTSMMDATQAKSQAWEKISAPRVMRQVENAFIRTLDNGAKQLTLQLTPENLGKLNIMLQVNGKEVSAMIKADTPEAAKIITENINTIKSALEDQGLKVEKLEVQAGLTGNKDAMDWFGRDQHNMNREKEMMAAMRNHMRSMREEGTAVAQDMQSIREQAINADQGLYVIA